MVDFPAVIHDETLFYMELVAASQIALLSLVFFFLYFSG